MGKALKKTIGFLFFLIAGIGLGTAVGKLCEGVKYLDWLSYNMTIGIDTGSPFVLDLILFKLAFGLTLSINGAQIIMVILALIIYNKTCKNM